MAVHEAHNIQSLQRLLVCPVCKSTLHFSPEAICCSSCGQKYEQSRPDCVDLLPSHLIRKDRGDWDSRQQEMEQWYRGLIANPKTAVDCYVDDYSSYFPLLTLLTGAVLDIGGGNGIVRHYLPPSVRYISIDPSVEWLGNDWGSIAETFPCLKEKLCFVRGVGEYLPFPPNCFDAVLAFWSLNHARCPAMIFQESYRVLTPGGRFIVSLEEMVPQWLDVIKMVFLTGGSSRLTNIVKRKIRCSLMGEEWPIQDDHIRIHESDIRHWTTGKFKRTKRMWIKTYLTFEFRKA